MKKIVLLFIPLLLLVSCSSESLSTKKATSLIQEFCTQYPVFESGSIALGDQKINTNKNAQLVEALKKLEAEKLITLETKDVRKKLLSKDSIWEVTVRLTSDASKYVLDQKKNKAQVKTFLFTLQEDHDVSLKLNAKAKATATAKLIKESTPFAEINADKNPNTDFISRDFVLRYKKDIGWYVVK